MWIVLALTFLFLTACAAEPLKPIPLAPAPERYLSAQEDNEFRERCEDFGCVVVPIPLWEQILKRLKAGMRQGV